MTRVLIVGGAGMLGHKLWQAYQSRFDAWVTLRGSATEYQRYQLFPSDRTFPGVDVGDADRLATIVATVRPDAIVNAVGVVKQLPTAKDPLVSLAINSTFPHRLAVLGRLAGARVVHVSTDCIFSGRKGAYKESDTPDADDLYGRTKFLGEIEGAGALTLRTSIIGRELKTRSGLVEWFLSQRGGRVRGYSRAVFSGLTTIAFARALGDILERHPALEGVYHLSSAPITKCDLLHRLRTAYRADVTIDADESVRIDRSLDSTRLQQAAGYQPPSWDDMIAELAADPTPYEQWRA
jgi:dTDP-4-dehydrorhamnose reductase